MKIVQFKDGQYAIRKGWFFYKYKSLLLDDYWWPTGYSTYYRTKDFDLMLKIFNDLTDKGKPI
jgi:hypothetical protein